MPATVLISIDVDDLERAVAFYTAAFGLKIGRRLGPSVVELTGGTAPSTCWPRPPARGRPRHGRAPPLCAALDPGASRHHGVAPGSRLRESPGRRSHVGRGPATHNWGKIAPLADPFGHGLCLIEFLGRGYDEIAIG